MLITADQVLALGPCSRYTEEIIRKNHGKHGIRPEQINTIDIPVQDRFWVLIRLVPRDCLGACAEEFAGNTAAAYAAAVAKHFATMGDGSYAIGAATTAASFPTVGDKPDAINAAWERNCKIAIKYIEEAT